MAPATRTEELRRTPRLRRGNPGRKPTPHLFRRPLHRVSRLVPQGSLLEAFLADQRAAPHALPVYQNHDGAELLTDPSREWQVLLRYPALGFEAGTRRPGHFFLGGEPH